MRVVSVQLRDFRSYRRAEALLGDGLTVVHGPNGAGKSNLLEALYFGCTGCSPRTRSERELVRFGAQAARVSVRVSSEGRIHELTVGFQPGQAKRMTADGAPVERLADVSHRPLVSVFSPDRLELVKGAPARRRAHLDRFAAALWPSRRGTRVEYARCLAQRNALIASMRAGRSSAVALPSWDEQLARHAIDLCNDRAQAVELLRAPFAAFAAQLGLEGELALHYRARARVQDAREYVERLRDGLREDLRRGFTTYGPHRDDLALLRDGRELRAYGSQGEQRLALLALLLSERAALARRRAHVPLMLLDDVMSELDSRRRELLAGELSSGGQSVIAATDLAHVPGAAGPGVSRLRVASGAVFGEALAA